MKVVTAFIRPEMLNEVIYKLHELEGIKGASVSKGKGFGSWRLKESADAVQSEEDNFKPFTRIDVVSADEFTESIKKAIIEYSGTGKAGDGIVYTADLDSCYCIRTGLPV